MKIQNLSKWQYSITIKCYQTSFQVTDLGPFGSATIDAGGLEARSSAIFQSHLLHLLCQLTSWCKHQTLATRAIGDFSTGLKVQIAPTWQRKNTHNGTIATFQECLMVNVYDSRQQILQSIKHLSKLNLLLKSICKYRRIFKNKSNLQKVSCQIQSVQCQPCPCHWVQGASPEPE